MYRKPILLAVVVFVGLLTACGQATNAFGEIANKPDAEAQPTAGQAGGVQPVVTTSELVVGPNRMALGLIENNVPIPDAAQTRVHVRFFKLKGDQARLVSEEDAQYYGEGLGARGTFVTHPTFDTPGEWGLEVQMKRPGKPASTQRLGLEVAQKGSAVPIGARAPRSKTPTAAQVKDLRTITSASNPDPRLYRLSVDQAVTSEKPSMILFATPGFCQTAVCGPGVDVLDRLANKFGDKVNAVHVEVYQYPFERLKPVKTMDEWGLQTEPWLFLVDKTGHIAARFEGGITYPEIEPEVAKLMQRTN